MLSTCRLVQLPLVMYASALQASAASMPDNRQRVIAIWGEWVLNDRAVAIGKISHHPPHEGRACTPWHGWLACCALPWLGVAWACLPYPALAWFSSNNSQDKAAKTGPGQTRPWQHTPSKLAKPRHVVMDS